MKRYFVALLFAWAYAPLFTTSFLSDDYIQLAFSSVHGFDPRSLFEPIHQHVIPLMRLLIGIEFSIFGTDAAPYYAVSVLLHLMCVALTGALIFRLLKDRTAAGVAMMVFALGASHADVVQWITCQGQLLATLFFLLSLHLFLSFIETRKSVQMFLSVLCHLLMMFSFSMGAEVPVLYFALVPALDRARGSLKRAAAVAAPFACNVGLYTVARSVLGAEEMHFQGTPGEFFSIPVFIAGGIYHGFVQSFTGSYFSLGANVSARYAYQLGIVLLFAVLIARAPHVFRGKRAILVWMAGAVVLLYLLPAFARLPWGYGWFVHTGRYRYHLAIFAAGVFGAAFSALRPIGSEDERGLRALLMVWLFSMLIMNAAQIHEVNTGRRDEAQKFQRLIERYLAALESGEERTVIVDRSFATTIGFVAGWNVRPSQLCEIYCSAAARGRVTFVPEKFAAEWGGPEPLSEVEEDTGRIKGYQPELHKPRHLAGIQ